MHLSRDWDVVYGENTDCTAKRHGNPNTPIQEGHENGSSCYLVRVSGVMRQVVLWKILTLLPFLYRSSTVFSDTFLCRECQFHVFCVQECVLWFRDDPKIMYSVILCVYYTTGVLCRVYFSSITLIV